MSSVFSEPRHTVTSLISEPRTLTSFSDARPALSIASEPRLTSLVPDAARRPAGSASAYDSGGGSSSRAAESLSLLDRGDPRRQDPRGHHLLQSQMQGLQGKVSSLGQRIEDMYLRTSGGQDSLAGGGGAPPARPPRDLLGAEVMSSVLAGFEAADDAYARRSNQQLLARAARERERERATSALAAAAASSGPAAASSAAAATSLRWSSLLPPASDTTGGHSSVQPSVTGGAMHTAALGRLSSWQGPPEAAASLLASPSRGAGAAGGVPLPGLAPHDGGGTSYLGGGQYGTHGAAPREYSPPGRGAYYSPGRGGRGGGGGGSAGPTGTGWAEGRRRVWEAGAPPVGGVLSQLGAGQQQQQQQQQQLLQQQEEERLRGWIQELRHERRRLEDKLLAGDSQGMRALDMRDDLENQVLGLSRQRDALEAEVGSMAGMQQAVQGLEGEVEGLRAALRGEAEKQVRQDAARAQLESALSDIGVQLAVLQQAHASAVDELTKERSAVTLKYKKAAHKAALSEETGEKLRVELQHLREELAARELAAAEAKAMAEVVQATNAQLRGQMSGHARELEARVSDLQRALDEQRAECSRAQQQLAAAVRDAAAADSQSKELSARAEFLRSEREKLLKVLASEQQQAALYRHSVEALQSQIRSVEGQKVDLDSNARIQLESLQKQYEVHASTAQKQFDLQVTALERQYASLQKQYDAAVAAHERLLSLHESLRKERDELWAGSDGTKAEAAALRQEKEELAARLAALRGEVKQSMDDVVQDREQQLQALAQQHEQIVQGLRAQYESRLAGLQRDSDAKIRGALELAGQLRTELAEAQQDRDKQRAAVGHLRDQVKEALLGRDDVTRELEAERDFTRELNRLLNQIRGTDGPEPRNRGP